MHEVYFKRLMNERAHTCRRYRQQCDQTCYGKRNNNTSTKKPHIHIIQLHILWCNGQIESKKCRQVKLNEKKLGKVHFLALFGTIRLVLVNELIASDSSSQCYLVACIIIFDVWLGPLFHVLRLVKWSAILVSCFSEWGGNGCFGKMIFIEYFCTDLQNKFVHRNIYK